MFTPDVMNLRQFYATPLGREARMLLTAGIMRMWPEARGDTVLGLGYATPYLEPYLPHAAVLACMPAGQGAAYWPPSRANLAFLAHESELPLPENSVNRALLVHSAEHSEQLSGMMRDLWRVLTPGGRVLLVVPNRLSLWARSSRSPFGYGQPFSMAQLRDLVGHHQFTVTRSSSALILPPTRLHFLWRAAPRIEKVGRLLCPFLGGVLLLEAEKQVYAAIKQPSQARQGYRVPVTAAKPAMMQPR